MANDIVLETKLVGAITGNFYVPSYQRGYRWGEDEVVRLLNDVYQNGKKNYCLQPIVVRKRDDVYELIDGQQRLTTLYLIYKYINNINPLFFNKPAFSIEYETRKESAEFLEKIDFDRQEENIDFWFIANAYKAIQKWFSEDLQIRVMRIFEYFKDDVRVIWYEVTQKEDAVSLFTRLNIGKIPLSSAELVKAMFLSRDNTENIDRIRQEEISLQWDNIEKALHKDSFWCFLSNNDKNTSKPLIALILDLISGKPESNKEKYYTFFKFDEMRKNISLEEIWRKIQQTFLVLKDWYENDEFYHKIGYLIASDTSYTLQKIYELSNNKTKKEFNDMLDGFIKDSICITGNYADLRYDKASDYRKLSTLLLLFNVVSVQKTETQRFPFNLFKGTQNGKSVWSLEHIHAQQSEGMQTQEAWKMWIELHINSVKTIGSNHSELLKEMQEALNKVKLERNEFEIVQKKVLDILSVAGSNEYLHTIANLALLSSDDNAALNNSTFDVKRNKIIEMDREGKYIPFCTKMVFLKYYTPSENNQLHFWGQPDRDAYIASINEKLKVYLNQPIILEKGE